MQNDDMLREMGLTPWQYRQAVSPMRTDTSALEACAKAVEQCQRCQLSKTRTNTVFGVGNPRAQLMLCGEAPGYYEDQQGEPFVGKAGVLLNAMLKSINLSREEVYIANVLKCRPPNNRDPSLEEVSQCFGYLETQIQLIQPKIILALGRIATHHLLGVSTSLSRLRGEIHQIPSTQTPVLATYHPAYLLRNPADKRKAYADLCQLSAYLST